MEKYAIKTIKPFDTSSGNLLADRRADYAEMLFADGEAKPAAELLLGALELAPGWAMGWFRLGEFHEAAGRRDAAVAAWRTVLELDAEDRPGAALKLALIGAQPAADAPPSAFVEALFDQYADTFDKSLVGDLGYRAPELLAAAIGAAAPGRRLGRAIDLGCGTGLMGERLRPLADDLEGHDISAAMLAKARARGVYDRLVKSDLQMLTLPTSTAELITAADVFMYVGALDRVFRMVAQALAPGGLFAFTVELNDDERPFRLRETRRYAHSEDYVRAKLADASLLKVTIERGVVRKDREEPVDALIVTASRT